jgi:hypothetical protein
MSVLSRLAVAASILDFEAKRFFRELLLVNTVTAAGSSATDAAPLSARKNVVLSANDAKGVILPRSELDMEVVVVNTVSNKILLVYPNTGEQINALTATTGYFSVPAGASATFYCDSIGHWYVAVATALSGVTTTSSSAELNILTGATVTAAELNTAADQSAQTELLVADGAVSVTKRITKIEDTGTGSYTLAAPNAALLGMVKLIEMTADNGDITLALTNVDGAAGNTTATFNTVGQHVALVAGVSKWLYLNGTASLS